MTRIYADGVRMTLHVRHSSATRGVVNLPRLVVEEGLRSTGLVASLAPTNGEKSIPDLQDVRLLGQIGGSWALGGFEETVGGPMERKRRSWQVWLVEPASAQDVIDAERRWAQAAEELHELRELVNGWPKQLP